jgi:hypothetical protein
MVWVAWGIKVFCIIIGVICIVRGFRYSKESRSFGDSPLSWIGDNIIFSLISELILRFLPWWLTNFLWILFGIGWICLGIFAKIH